MQNSFSTSNYFQTQLQLLKIEQDADQAQHIEVIQNQSPTQRRASGLTWYPVAIRGQESNSADYLKVEFERTTHQEVDHQFKTGAPIRFFSNHDEKTDFIKGTVTHVGSQKMAVLFKTEELPDWASMGKLGLDVLFDEGSYKEMNKAMKLLDNYLANDGKKDKLPIIDAIFGQKLTQINIPTTTLYYQKALNESQQEAVKNMVWSQDFSIIHGPPGTGKTSTLVEGIVQMVKNGTKKILVTAASNMAVDHLAEKIDEAGIQVVRIGNFAKVSEKLQRLTLDAKAQEYGNDKEIKRLKKQASEYQNMAHKYKRSFGRSEREQRKALFNEAYKLLDEVDKLKNYGTEQVYNQVKVVCCTLVASATQVPKSIDFEAVIIDEAGQALEPACWIPIINAKKIILAGDHLQLPPTIKSTEALKKGFSTTLFEKLVENFPNKVTLLNTQYRMNEAIMACINEHFYENKLIASVIVKDRTLEEKPKITFFDTAGASFDEENEGTSLKNEKEANILIQILTNELETLNSKNISVGIISPYKTQIENIKNKVKAENLIEKYNEVYFKINTVDSFQGQESDLIIISLVRSNDKGEIGFLADLRRMNVALSRAKKRLIVIGDSATLSYQPFYLNLINHFEKNGEYKSVFEIL